MNSFITFLMNLFFWIIDFLILAFYFTTFWLVILGVWYLLAKLLS